MVRIPFIFSSLATILVLFQVQEALAFCPPTQNVKVVVTPEIDCLTVTSMKVDCNSNTELTLTNNCGSNIIGIEHQSLNRDIIDGYPPLESCIQPWLEAVSMDMKPPPCILVHGGTAKVFALGDEKLIFDLNGSPLTIELELIQESDDISDEPSSAEENKGCSIANDLPFEGFMTGFFMAMVLFCVIRLRKMDPSYSKNIPKQ